jgi:SAM-dependent methyltransferase
MEEMARVANTDQAEAWNGDEGSYWVSQHARHEAMRERLTPHLLPAAHLSTTDRVLDIGCGCGGTTRAAARAAHDGSAFGIDLSRPMLDLAERAAAEEGPANVRFGQGDAQVYPFGTEAYDVAISSFGIMFFTDPPAAFANIVSALRVGGRLAFLCWQDVMCNQQFAIPLRAAMAHMPLPEMGRGDEPGPFSLADREKLKVLLTRAGCADVRIDAVNEPVRVGSDVEDVVSYFRGMPMVRRLIQDADEAVTARIFAAMAEGFAPHQGPDGVRVTSAAWLVTAQRAR